ncbi:hypothetical protein BDY21DRAFT_322876 [Lineolata rhizophorae]|uniref:Peroxisomal membrane protein Pex17 n=1 Tax=Lineolata rhizophorae TaxID=578093 RepID=A0A6A6NYH8_9PEZI|nr:hypothetical protein BDY21DRAFT_322876 [Lineolata rhizophorae]
MPADRLLGTLLRSLQTYSDQQDTPRLLSTASTLLTTLTNPLNITLLTTQLLLSPSLFPPSSSSLAASLRLLAAFHTAARTVQRHERHLAAQRRLLRHQRHHHHSSGAGAGGPRGAGRAGYEGPGPRGAAPVPGLEEWVRAVVRGAETDRAERWKHVLVLGGLLVGFESGVREEGELEELEEEGIGLLGAGLRSRLGEALVRAGNLALREGGGAELGGMTVALVLNHAFPYLEDGEREAVEYDLLLPVLINATFFSSEGLQSAYFLGSMDLDVKQVPGKKFNWPKSSQSFNHVQRILSQPLMASLGPLSRLMAHAVENVRDSWLIQAATEDIAAFARSMLTQWRQNKLSEIDVSEEAVFLHGEALKETVPVLWRLLRSTMFAIVIILRAVVGRLIGDGTLAADGVSPHLVTQVLHTLRGIYFISSRLGPSSFSQYTFISFAAIDILTQYPQQSDAFIHAIAPSSLGSIPSHPLDRTLDLFFLNTVEHFTLALSPQATDTLVLPAARPYLTVASAAASAPDRPSSSLLPLFEAAHAAVLALLSAPAAAEQLGAPGGGGGGGGFLPFYVDTLFAMFPGGLSPRQFRLAFRTLMRVAAPPAPLAVRQPEFAEVLVEMVRRRAETAGTEPLAQQGARAQAQGDASLTPQSVLVLALLDALPFLPPPALDEWLPEAARLVRSVRPEQARDACAARLWEVLLGGEMDPERALVCVAWWEGRGGRDLVFGEAEGDGVVAVGNAAGDEGLMMSGGLPVRERESKL